MATYTTLAGACLSVIVSMSISSALAQPPTNTVAQRMTQGTFMPLSWGGRYAAWQTEQQPGYKSQLARVTETAAPSIVSGKILTPSLDVKVAPAAPKISFKYTAPGLLSFVQFWFASPSGQGQIVMWFQIPLPESKSGQMVVEQHGPGLYAEPGVWTLAGADIEDSAGNWAAYNGAQLLAIFPSLTLTVKNGGTPDITPPTVSAGTILTPTVSLSAKLPYFKARFTVADDVSGVNFIQMGFTDPNNNFLTSTSAVSSPTRSGTEIEGLNFTNFYSAAIGTYTIGYYMICDVANNCLESNGDADIKRLFGTDTFQVTK